MAASPAALGPRRVMAMSVTAAGVAAVCWLGYRHRVVFLGAYVGVVVAAAVRPLVAWLERHRVRRELGAAGAFLLLAAAAASFVIGVLPLLLEQVAALWARLPEHYGHMRDWLLGSGSRLVREAARSLPSTLELGPLAPSRAAWMSTGSALATALVSAGAVLLFAFYWTLEGERAVQAATLLAPQERREEARSFWAEAERRLGGYVRGQLLACVVVGALALAAYLVIGVPDPLIFGLIAAVMEMVPVVGPTLGAAPAVLVMLPVSPIGALWVGLASLAIQLLENYVLTPRLLGKRTGTHPLLCLLAIIAFGTLFGLLGVLLAIPITVLLTLAFERWAAGAGVRPPAARDRLALLRWEARGLALAGRRQWQSDGVGAAARDCNEEIEAIACALDDLLGSPQEAASGLPDEPARQVAS